MEYIKIIQFNIDEENNIISEEKIGEYKFMSIIYNNRIYFKIYDIGKILDLSKPRVKKIRKLISEYNLFKITNIFRNDDYKIAKKILHKEMLFINKFGIKKLLTNFKGKKYELFNDFVNALIKREIKYNSYERDLYEIYNN